MRHSIPDSLVFAQCHSKCRFAFFCSVSHLFFWHCTRISMEFWKRNSVLLKMIQQEIPFTNCIFCVSNEQCTNDFHGISPIFIRIERTNDSIIIDQFKVWTAQHYFKITELIIWQEGNQKFNWKYLMRCRVNSQNVLRWGVLCFGFDVIWKISVDLELLDNYSGYLVLLSENLNLIMLNNLSGLITLSLMILSRVESMIL